MSTMTRTTTNRTRNNMNEFTTDEVPEEKAPLVVAPVADAKPNGKKEAVASKPKPKDDEDGEPKPAAAKLSPEIAEMRRNEDRTLKDIIEGFGQHTAYKIKVTRQAPSTHKVNGRVYQTSGFLEWVEGEPIDEKWLQERYGGGKYEL